MSYLVEKNHTLEELITFGLEKFEVSDEKNRKYVIELVSSNHFFYSTTRAALKNLLSHIIKHEPTLNAFFDWLETVAPIYLKEGEVFYKITPELFKDFIIANHEDVLKLEEKINNLEKRIDVLYDLFEELLKKIDNN